MGCSDASRERWRFCQWLQNSGVRPEYRWGHMQGITLLEFENRTLAPYRGHCLSAWASALLLEEVWPMAGPVRLKQNCHCGMPFGTKYNKGARPQSLSEITHGVRLGARVVNVLACAYRAWSTNEARVDITLPRQPKLPVLIFVGSLMRQRLSTGIPWIQGGKT